MSRRIYFIGGLLLFFSSTHCVLGQESPHSADLAVTYSAARSIEASNQEPFWMQGGSIELGTSTWRGLGVAANVSGLHTSSIGTGSVPLSLVTTTFGPRYRLHPQRSMTRISPYGEVLLGVANGFDSVFPGARSSQSSAESFALQIGGGIDYDLGHRLSVRVLHISWLRTYLPNGTDNIQNTLILGSGLALRFGH